MIESVDLCFTNLADSWWEPLEQLEAEELKALFLAQLERYTKGYDGM